MIKIRRLFEIHYDDPEHSLAELTAFGTDTLQRLVANNPGAVFNTIITGLTVALSTLGACATDDQTKLGIRKAAKLVKDTFRETVETKLKRIEGRIIGAYESPDPEVLACFPGGRTIFHTETDDRLHEHFETLVNNLAPRIPVMGAQAHADAGGLQSTWIAIHAASETASGSKTATEQEKAEARANLCRQLAIATLTVAIHHIGEPEMADTYFPQHLLEDHPPAPPAPPLPPPPVPG